MWRVDYFSSATSPRDRGATWSIFAPARTGIDPENNYLEQLVHGERPISYKDNPGEKIEMKNGMRFITKPIGPMPVS
jgi:hypothetical protein